MMAAILIIDDDEELTDLLETYLGDFGYKTTAVSSPSKGIELLVKSYFDLVILDVMLPEMDGFNVCKTIRETHSIPIIMLTARGEITDRVVGLELGADDYLPKPFEPRELVARIQAVLRRGHKPAKKGILEIGDLKINLEKYTTTIDGVSLDLTTTEFEMLVLLVQSGGRVLSRDYIMQHIRGVDWTAFDRSVDVLISRIRHKLKDDPRNPHYIRTIRGAGYVFVGATEAA